MVTWWETLTTIERIFAYVAIPSTLILVIQTVMTLVGMGDNGADSDFDLDTDSAEPADNLADMDIGGNDLQVFTLRAIIAFFSIFGWMGIVASKGGAGTIGAIALSCIAGVAAMLGVAYAMRAILKMQTSGNIQAKNAIGKKGAVYLTIPPGRRANGKVTVLVQERYTEFEAVTDEHSPIATGQEVEVIDVLSENILLVQTFISNSIRVNE